MKFFLAAILLVSLIALSSADDDEFGKPTKAYYAAEKFVSLMASASVQNGLTDEWVQFSPKLKTGLANWKAYDENTSYTKLYETHNAVAQFYDLIHTYFGYMAVKSPDAFKQLREEADKQLPGNDFVHADRN